LTSSNCSRILRHHIFHREARPALDPNPRFLGHSVAIRHSRWGIQPHRHRRQVCLPRPPPGNQKTPHIPPQHIPANSIRQFFFNFGANPTTFIIPAEAFPTRVRGFAHGVSAATGKVGAILSALLFNYLSGPELLGLANVLWIFFVCCILGAAITWFLIPETKGRDADVTDYEEWMEMNIRER